MVDGNKAVDEEKPNDKNAGKATPFNVNVISSFLSNTGKHTDALRHISLSLCCLGIIGMITIFSFRFVEQTSEKWSNHLRHFQEEGSEADNPKESLGIYLQKYPDTTAAEKDRIEKQIETVQERARMHLLVANDFYKWIFVSTCVSSLSAIISAGCLFYIGKSGWDKTNNYVINIFIVFSGFALFTISLPKLYNHQENAENNIKLYLAYVNLEDQIFTRLVLDIPNSSNETGVSSQKTLIQNVIYDTQIKIDQLNSFSIDIDPSSIVLPKSIIDGFQLQEGN